MLLVARRCPPESGHGCTCQRYFCRQGSLVFFLSLQPYKGGDLFPVFSHRLPRAPKSRSGYLLGSGEKLESREHCEFRVSRHVFLTCLSLSPLPAKQGPFFHTPFKRVLGRCRLPVGGDFFFLLLAKVVLSDKYRGKESITYYHSNSTTQLSTKRKGLDSSIKNKTKHYTHYKYKSKKKKGANIHHKPSTHKKKEPPPLYFRTLGSRLGRSPRD